MKFTDSHEWIVVKEGIGTVGITQHAQKELGDIVYVELPKKGKRVAAGEEAAVLESTKAAADVYSPVSGVILEVNEALQEDSGLVNRLPEGEGWIFKIVVEDPSQLEQLMDLESYLAILR